MVARLDFDNIGKFMNKSGLSLIDFVPQSELGILVVSHSEHVSIFGQNKGVKYTTSNLLDFSGEGD